MSDWTLVWQVFRELIRLLVLCGKAACDPAVTANINAKIAENLKHIMNIYFMLACVLLLYSSFTMVRYIYTDMHNL